MTRQTGRLGFVERGAWALLAQAALFAASTTLPAQAQSLAHGFTPIAAAADSPAVAAFWQQSGTVTKAALLLLAAMTLASVYVLLRRGWSEALGRRHAATAETRFWTAASLYEAVQHLEPGSVFRRVAEDALEAAAHREGRLTDTIALDQWLGAALERSVAAADRRARGSFEMLAAVAATAPVVGLAAGLWAMCQPLLGAAGRELAGAGMTAAAGEAFAVTALGLAVGTPAALGHRWLVRRSETLVRSLRDFAADMRAVLLSNDAALGALDDHPVARRHRPADAATTLTFGR